MSVPVWHQLWCFPLLVSHADMLDLQEAKVSTLLDFLEKPKALRDVNLAERVSHNFPWH